MTKKILIILICFYASLISFQIKAENYDGYYKIYQNERCFNGDIIIIDGSNIKVGNSRNSFKLWLNDSKSGHLDKETIKLKAPYGYYYGKIKNNEIKLKYKNTKKVPNGKYNCFSRKLKFIKDENIIKPKLTTYNENNDPSAIKACRSKGNDNYLSDNCNDDNEVSFVSFCINIKKINTYMQFCEEAKKPSYSEWVEVELGIKAEEIIVEKKKKEKKAKNEEKKRLAEAKKKEEIKKAKEEEKRLAEAKKKEEIKKAKEEEEKRLAEAKHKNVTKINYERKGYDVLCESGSTLHQNNEVFYLDGSAKLTFDLIKNKYLAELEVDDGYMAIRFNKNLYDKNNNYVGEILQNLINVNKNQIYFKAYDSTASIDFKYSMLNNILEVRFLETPNYLKFICQSSDAFLKDFNNKYNPTIQKKSNPESNETKLSVSLSNDEIKEKLKFYKELYDEELISIEEYEAAKKQILSGGISIESTTTKQTNINQINEQLEIEKQKLEEMKRQTEVAQKELQEQKRIADEASKANRRLRYKDSIKTMKKGLCLAYGGNFNSC